MKFSFEQYQWGILECRIGNWFFSFYFNPKVWGLDYHKNAACCKWWLLVGPFEVNRVWTDEDTDYPEEFK